MQNVNKGIYPKYIVKKADGSDFDPNAKYFVLRADTDHHARIALLAYANSVEESNPVLAQDLRVLVYQYEE